MMCQYEQVSKLKLITLVQTCTLCETQHQIQVVQLHYELWQKGMLAQDAFPYLNVHQREMLISGICGECWDKMFESTEKEKEDMCWYCQKDNTDVFSFEFDTPLHLNCLKEVLRNHPDDREARIMGEELLTIEEMNEIMGA